jgi:hypothetical protein
MEMHMKRMIFFVSIFFLILFSVESSGTEEPVKKVDGWGGYKFGMSMAQAASVRKDARWEEIEYQSGNEKCLVDNGNFYGEKGKIVVRFKEGKLWKIHLDFNRFQGGCDEKLARPISDALLTSYGTKYTKQEGRSLVWRFPQGGMITFSYFCITEGSTDFKPEAIGTGGVYVIYEQSEGF